MAILAAYLDDSFEDKCGVYAIAGYIGDVDMWDTWHAPSWRHAVIDCAPHRISEFKASDCRQKRGEFEGWTDPESDALYRTAVEVTTQCCEYEHILGVGASVCFQPENMAQFEEHGFGICLYHILEEALRISAKVLPWDGILQLVLDEKPSFKARAQRHFDVVNEWLRKEGAAPAKVKSPNFKDSKDVSVLQAADLLAYETFKETKSRIDGSNRKVSGALQALVEKRYHRARCLSWGTVLEAAARLRDGRDCNSLGAATLYASGEPWRSQDQWPYA